MDSEMSFVEYIYHVFYTSVVEYLSRRTFYNERVSDNTSPSPAILIESILRELPPIYNPELDIEKYYPMINRVKRNDEGLKTISQNLRFCIKEIKRERETREEFLEDGEETDFEEDVENELIDGFHNMR